jgi:nucleotide-binding universal stress UspA family protein
VLVFLAKFDARCRLEGVGCTVLEDVGRPDEQIVREAQSCDVVILGREENFHFETEERDDETLGRVLRTSPRPVVVVPDAPASGSGVLVAYGGGREVARTLQSFTLLGVADGEMLDVVAIHPDREEVERRLRPAGEYLTAHGLPHRLRPVVSEAPAADVILDEVRRLAPRLVVMGAHAHHPLRELFVTSVARAVLSATPVPVFVGA